MRNEKMFALTPRREGTAMEPCFHEHDAPANPSVRNLKRRTNDSPSPVGWERAGVRVFLFLILLVAVSTFANSAFAKEPAEKPLVQIAILLDTSGSMDGLIEQAKSQLWKICNEFIKARQN